MKISILLIVFLSLFASCASKRPEGATEAEVLFKEATINMEKGRYILANEKLNALRAQFPYSYYATPAELLQADILFKQENYVEAAAAYLVFKDFHPKHKDMAYVIQRIADSFYFQLPSTFDRDLTPGVEAMKHYDDLLRYYGDTDYAKEAKVRIDRVKEMLEDKDIYIADFYYRTEDYEASRARYVEMIPGLTNEKDRERAITRVLQASLILKDLPSCEKYYSEYISKVNELMKKELTSIYEKCSQTL